MARSEPIVYLNGRYLPKAEAGLPVEDRAALFGDGVYEVVRYYNGRAFEMDRHIDRLKQSLCGIRVTPPASVDSLNAISDHVVEQSGLAEAKVYWQVSRGAAPREHTFPSDAEPTVLVMAYPAEPVDPRNTCPAMRAILHPDRRWADCWIKTVMLLPNVLAKQAAVDAGAGEAILHAHGHVTEGTTTSVFAVFEGELFTYPLDGRILPSITRQVLIECAQREGLTVREEPVSVAALYQAAEVLIASTTSHVTGITHVDDHPIADTRVGPVTQRLHAALLQRINDACHAVKQPASSEKR